MVQSVGVSLTEVQDAVFRLGYFERTDTFLSWPQLTRDLQWHYAGQAVKQFYVLVFGLDVLGNPFGLALGISQGVEQLFYEPFQGGFSLLQRVLGLFLITNSFIVCYNSLLIHFRAFLGREGGNSLNLTT